MCSVDFMQVLSKIYLEGGLPYPFVQLQTLKIQTTSLNRHDIPGIACLFKSSPMVHTILIEILGDGARENVSFGQLYLYIFPTSLYISKLFILR
jgi:hypothetical protein